MKLLWNIRLWFIGITLIILMPFVLLWKVLIDTPIEWATQYLASKDEE